MWLSERDSVRLDADSCGQIRRVRDTVGDTARDDAHVHDVADSMSARLGGRGAMEDDETATRSPGRSFGAEAAGRHESPAAYELLFEDALMGK